MEYDGFDVNRIKAAFKSLRVDIRRHVISWIMMRGPKVKKSKLLVQTNGTEKAIAACIALAKAGATFSQVSNVFGASFAGALVDNPAIPVRCKVEKLPRALSCTSTQYLSVDSKLYNFQFVRSVELNKLFFKKLSAEKVQIVSDVHDFLLMSRTDQSIGGLRKIKPDNARINP